MSDQLLNRLELTPGLRRAILHGAAAVEEGTLSAAALLAGLLLEEESRAAAMLRHADVSLETVKQRWPDLVLDETVISAPVSADDPMPAVLPELATVFAATVNWASSHHLPVELATEHLLLGLLCEEATTEVGVWLREQGLSLTQVSDEILRRFGMDVAEVPIEDWTFWDDVNEADKVSPVACDGTEKSPVAVDRANLLDKPASRFHEPLEMPDDSEGLDQPGLPEETVEMIPILRTFDASANRAREALRVVEDYVRFVLDDAHLTEQLKRLRHEMTAAIGTVPVTARLVARETQADVGTRISTPSERERDGLGALVTANFSRLQEALRSMEEFGKLLDSAMAVRLEQARYAAYTLHSAVENTRMSIDRLSGSQLYVLLDGCDSSEAFEALATTLIAASVDLIQLRDKRLDDRPLLERARLLRRLTDGTGTLFIMNDRPDLALLADADGVHLGQEELTVKDARRIVGPDCLVGVSTHSIEQARAAVLDGANYIGVGPTFTSGTKHFDDFPGLNLLKAVAAEIRLPAFAIGGINATNLPAVLETGVRRIAVSGGVLDTENPGEAATRLLDRLL